MTLFLLCFIPVLASTLIGIRWGRGVAPDKKPESGHLGTVQGALLGLLGLLLGFAFSGAIGRFVERQDALAAEANAIETAYSRAQLLPAPTGDLVREELRQYAALRIRLFNESVDGSTSKIEDELQSHYQAAYTACLVGAKQAPPYAALTVQGVEGVSDQFTRRTALARRHMPTEFVLVMLVCSTVSLGAIGYGAGLVEQRSTGVVIWLALLTSTTLFVTFDFDRPRRGLIRLDPTPLQEVAAKLGSSTGAR